MQVAPVSSTDPTAAASNAATSDAATSAFGLSFDALLKIILTQLTYQDPLKPMDNFQFVSQLAQFSQIQIGQTTNDKLTALVSAQGGLQAAGLLGKQVDIGSDAGVVSGTVTAVSFSSGTPLLTIETTDNQTISSISLASVSQIRRIEMLGAIYIGLSGLEAYAKGLEQVSNNVTNLNTQGFKASTVSFDDVFGAQDNGGLSFSSEEDSAGHGVKNGTSQLDLTSGQLNQTDRDLDLAIDGSGFLMLMRGSDVAYTRTGSFEVDKDGYIVLSGTEYRLATMDSSGHPVAVSVDPSRTSPPAATTKITMSGNISADATDPVNVGSIVVYDKNGAQHTWTMTFTKDATATGQWTVSVVDETGKSIGTAQTVTFDPGGAIDPAKTSLSIVDSDTGLTVGVDLSGVTSYVAGTASGASTISAASVDGYAQGTITTVTINDAGQLELGYSNSQKKQLGAVAIADFRDPQELTQRTGGLFTDNGNAGREVLASGDPRVGKVVSRQLEASNVDLSKEFGNLILIQRGYQASSQIISVANDMLQQLFGIRGQGG